MSKRNHKVIEQRITLDVNRPPEIPAEWIEVLEKLHPITAVVVWSVLNDQLSAEIIGLAKYSPDVTRFNLVAVVAKGNPLAVEQVTKQANEELFDLFAVLLNHPRTGFLH